MNKLFFVEIDNFQTYEPALKLSQIIQNEQGAGYVYFDEKYHVLASYYSNKNDAEKVKENLKSTYQNAQIFCIEYPDFFTRKNLSSNQNSSIQNLIKETQKSLLQLEDFSIDFFSGRTSFEKTKILIKNCHQTIHSAIDEFKKNFTVDSKYNLTRTYLSSINKSFKNLSESNEQNFYCIMRFEMINIAISLAQFSESF